MSNATVSSSDLVIKVVQIKNWFQSNRLRQPSRQPRRSRGLWCSPRWEANGSSGLQTRTPGRCCSSRLSGWSPAGGGSWCCRPGLLESRSCWCNLEGCWLKSGCSQDPTVGGFCPRRLGSNSVPAPALWFSIHHVEYSHLLQFGKENVCLSSEESLSHLLVWSQLLLQLLRLLLDGSQVILYRLSRMHTLVKPVVQSSPESMQTQNRELVQFIL